MIRSCSEIAGDPRGCGAAGLFAQNTGLNPCAMRCRAFSPSERSPCCPGLTAVFGARNSAAKTMKLQKPPPNIHLRYIKLKTMAERGTVHEAAEAKNKLAALEAKYTFTGPAPKERDEQDLFAGAAKIKPDARKYRPVYAFDLKDSEIAAFAKWALLNAFRIEGVWRNGNGNKTELCVGAREADLPQLRHIVGVIVESFRRLWEQFRTGTGAEAADENPFYRGLYDGLMRDPRKDGESIPKPAPPKKRPKRRGKGAAAAPVARGHVRPHAYEVACALGEEIRLNHPLERVMESLETVLQVEGRGAA